MIILTNIKIAHMKFGFLFSTFLTIFCFTCSAKDAIGISLSCDTIKYLVKDEGIVIYDISLTNQSSEPFYIWFSKNAAHDESDKERILKHFLMKEDSCSISLFQEAMEADFTIIHDLFSTLTVKLSPKKQFSIQLLQEGDRDDDTDFDVIGYLKDHLVVYNEGTISKQIKGIMAFNQEIFYPISYIIIPLQKLKL